MNQGKEKIKIICFYGPESTGKTSMAKKLADHFKTIYVPEVAREMIESNQFTLEDIRKIGLAQNERVKEKIKFAHHFLICDTDILTTRIYSEYYLGEAPVELDELEKEIIYDRYFLFDIDVPWVYDGLRNLSSERHTMLEKFKQALEIRKIPYSWVKGNYQEREAFLISELEKLIS